MEKDEKATRDHGNCQENASTPTGVGRFTPHMMKSLGVPKSIFAIIIDNTGKKYFMAADGTTEDPPNSGCLWGPPECRGGMDGELPRWTKVCIGCAPAYDPYKCPKCQPPYEKAGDPCELDSDSSSTELW